MLILQLSSLDTPCKVIVHKDRTELLAKVTTWKYFYRLEKKDVSTSYTVHVKIIILSCKLWEFMAPVIELHLEENVR